MNWNSLKNHIVEGPVTYGFRLHLRVRDATTWLWRYVGTAFGHFSFGLSQFHGHSSWLVCEVALMCRADVNMSVQGFRVCRSSGSLSRNSSVRGCHKNPIQSNLSFYMSKNVREATQIDECPRPLEWYEEEKWLILWKLGLIQSNSPCNEPHSYQDTIMIRWTCLIPTQK